MAAVQRKAAWAAASLGGLLLLGLAVCGVLNLALGHRPLPAPADPPAKLAYRVAVLGDSQKGLANLERVVRAVQEQGADFILHTGDLVSTNDEGHYRLAALALHRAGLRVPFIVVPGNHDVKGGTERFRREAGDLERAFKIGGVAFVTVDNSQGVPPDAQRIAARIAETGRRTAVVLAMHVPPFDVKGAPIPEYAPFLKWLETSGVDYLFCGHVHDTFRKQVGGTTVVVNGVGGDYESWQLRQKVFANLLDVEGGKVVRLREWSQDPVHGVRENLEHLAIGHVAEAYRGGPLLCWAGTLLLAAGVGFSIGVLRQRP